MPQSSSSFNWTASKTEEFNDGISDSELVAATQRADMDLEVGRMRETEGTASDIELCEALDEYERSAADGTEGNYPSLLLFVCLFLSNQQLAYM